MANRTTSKVQTETPSDPVDAVLRAIAGGSSLASAVAETKASFTASEFRQRIAQDPTLYERHTRACVERRSVWLDGLIDSANELAQPDADTPRLRARLTALQNLLDRDAAPPSASEPADTAAANVVEAPSETAVSTDPFVAACATGDPKLALAAWLHRERSAKADEPA